MRHPPRRGAAGSGDNRRAAVSSAGVASPRTARSSPTDRSPAGRSWSRARSGPSPRWPPNWRAGEAPQSRGRSGTAGTSSSAARRSRTASRSTTSSQPPRSAHTLRTACTEPSKSRSRTTPTSTWRGPRPRPSSPPTPLGLTGPTSRFGPCFRQPDDPAARQRRLSSPKRSARPQPTSPPPQGRERCRYRSTSRCPSRRSPKRTKASTAGAGSASRCRSLSRARAGWAPLPSLPRAALRSFLDFDKSASRTSL